MSRRFSFLVAAGAGLLVALAAWGVVLGAAELVERRVRLPQVVVAGLAAADEVETPTRLEGVEGLVVWESNRGGRWRLWVRELGGGEERELLPTTADVRQCCPQLSPDGRLLAFLELPPGPDKYPEIETGRLLVLELDGLAQREVAAVARTYGENRAVVWRGSQLLVYIDGRGRTIERDLTTNTERVVLGDGHPTLGYLPSPDLRFATSGYPTFSPITDGRVVERRLLGGCQPLFTSDSRYGLWVSGAGGPLDRLDLETRTVETVLSKNDAVLPPGRGYFYFPALSADNRVLAVAASPNEHQHFTSDYDIFVMELDGAGLPIGPAARIGENPATDRFPTVWVAPLPLGRFEGEVPFPIALDLPGEGWTVELGGQPVAEGVGGRIELEVEAAGRSQLVARRGGEVLDGLVVATAAQPPRLEGIEWRGADLQLTFDEPLAAAPSVERESSPGSPLAVALEGRLVVVSGAIESGARLRVDQVVDRATRPNRASPLVIEVPARVWPAGPDGILVAWGGDANPAGAARAELPLAPSGLARFDRHFALVSLGEGGFWAPEGASADLVEAFRAANRIRLEIAIVPAAERRDGPVLALSGGPGRGRRQLVLEERSGRLDLVMTTAGEGPVTSTIPLGALPAGPSFWSVSWEPGRIRAWRDGKLVTQSDEIQGDLFHWRPRPLAVGAEPPQTAWLGVVEAVALGTGELDDERAAEAFARWSQRRALRQDVVRERLVGRVVAVAPVPRLDDISPYRDALRVVRLEVEGGAAGAGRVVHVAERVMLDGHLLPAADRTVGSRLELLVEPFDAQPQLEATYVSDGGLGSPEWFPVP